MVIGNENKNMSIHHVIIDSLGCRETDLPRTNKVFHELGSVGIDAEKVSRRTLSICAAIAISEDIQRGHLTESETFLDHFTHMVDAATDITS